MGSVPDLYTTGDNDPEIEPVSYYRHYLYCDDCGSFELDPWVVADNPAALERARQRLGKAALYASLLVVVAGWHALGLILSPLVLVLVVAGMALSMLVRSKVAGRAGEREAWLWWFVKSALRWGLLLAAAELLVSVPIPPTISLLAGALVVVGLLVARGMIGAKIRPRGLRCRRCDATYAYGAPLFTQLDANPRNLTVADVPRPLGSSPFERGASVEVEAPEPRSRLPQ
jgi:hypothetical protein